ncbi:MAG: hypothetical protein EB075_13795, partial [Bacteroidetes bacterium]|nr:hypothetical protein [Bacteroidota bacterium]
MIYAKDPCTVAARPGEQGSRTIGGRHTVLDADVSGDEGGLLQELAQRILVDMLLPLSSLMLLMTVIVWLGIRAGL